MISCWLLSSGFQDIYNRRADSVGFVNGLPLVFIELSVT